MLLELVETERDYVRDLGLVVEVSGLFLPHSQLEFFPPGNCNNAFSIDRRSSTEYCMVFGTCSMSAYLGTN